MESAASGQQAAGAPTREGEGRSFCVSLPGPRILGIPEIFAERDRHLSAANVDGDIGGRVAPVTFRGRRLVALEKRIAELKNMREGVSPEVRKACEEAVQVAVGEVEHWSSVTEARWAEVPHPLSPLDQEAVPKQKPAPSARRRPPSP